MDAYYLEYDPAYRDLLLSEVALTRQISLAFTARGNAHLASGRYHLAIRDYAKALFNQPAKSPCTPGAAEPLRSGDPSQGASAARPGAIRNGQAQKGLGLRRVHRSTRR